VNTANIVTQIIFNMFQEDSSISKKGIRNQQLGVCWKLEKTVKFLPLSGQM